MMKKIIITFITMGFLGFISCNKEKLCDCDLSDSFDTYRYELEEVLPLSYAVYTYQGIKQPLEPVDTLIRFYYYQNLPVIDSLIFSGESTGEYYTHSNRFNYEDTFIYLTSFNYTQDNNNYILVPVDISSTFIIDASEDNYLRLLTLGEDDEEIMNADRRVFEIIDDKLITRQYGIRIVQGSSTFETTVYQFSENAITENLNMGEEIYILHYQLEYVRK